MFKSHESGRKTVHINDVTLSHCKRYFTASMEEGLRLYQVNPLKLCYSVRLGPVRTSSLLDDNSVCLLVRGGSKPANETLCFNYETESVGASIVTPTNVISTLITEDKMVIVTLQAIHLYDVVVYPIPTTFTKIASYSTVKNPLGLCQMSTGLAAERLLCFPCTQTGFVRVVNIENRNTAQKADSWWKAHNHEIRVIRLSYCGNFLATASSQGTLIRLWSTSSKKLLVELRRGIDPVTLYDIDFSANGDFLCCVSDKGTGHIFDIKDKELSKINTSSDDQHKHSSLATFTVHGIVPSKLIAGVDGSVTVITLDGRVLVFGKDGGSQVCTRTFYGLYPDCKFDDSAISDDGDDDYIASSHQP